MVGQRLALQQKTTPALRVGPSYSKTGKPQPGGGGAGQNQKCVTQSGALGSVKQQETASCSTKSQYGTVVTVLP